MSASPAIASLRLAISAPLQPTREVVATGKALAPGFIDAHTHDDRAVLCGPECMLCKMSQGVTTVVVGNCGISLSPVRMKTRPVPPLDLLGDESWWIFDSFGAYAERLRAILAGEHLRADRPHLAAGRGDGRRYPARRHRQGSRAHAAPPGRGAGAGGVRLFHRAVLPAEHDGADRGSDRRGRSAARRRRPVRLAYARRGERRAAVDRGDVADRPGGERAGGDQPPQMRHAGELRPLDRDLAADRAGRGGQTVAIRRVSVSCGFDGADAGAAAPGRAGAGHLVGAASRSRRADAGRHRHANGGGRRARRRSGCCRPARSSSRWTSRMCGGLWRMGWR